MIKVTWEWLGMTPALDLANTVTVEDGVEHDLIEDPEEYARWASVEAGFLPEATDGLLRRERSSLLELRDVVRSVLSALSSGTRPATADLRELNRLSATTRTWVELELGSLRLEELSTGRPRDRLLARYARSAMELVAETPSPRRCPAPSCGMFFLGSRRAQRWCSPQCGTRARVARHYRNRRGVSP